MGVNKEIRERIKESGFLFNDDFWLDGHDTDCTKHHTSECWCRQYFKEARNSWINIVSKDLTAAMKREGYKVTIKEVAHVLDKNIISVTKGMRVTSKMNGKSY